MKTTVKLSKEMALIVEPGKGGGVVLRLGPDLYAEVIKLTPDQVGALIFGLENAAEAARIAQERATLAA